MSLFLKLISAAGKVIFPSLLWKKGESAKIIYLTFDDGPIPEVTPWVLLLLKEFDAKATFFCIGDNIKKYPEIFKQILAAGHVTGNHTFNHLNGWKTSTEEYVQNVLLAEAEIEKILNSKSKKLETATENQKLFRPPYGRIKPSQIEKLRNMGYNVVMWDVISEDYNQKKLPENCFHNVVTQAGPGSIIVLHDSTKASKNLKAILPRILEYYSKKGFEFRSL